MIETLEEAAFAIGALGWREGVFYWCLTLAFLVAAEMQFAMHGKRSRQFYQRLFDPLHYILAAGPFVACIVLSDRRDGQSFEGLFLALSLVSFFCTVMVLERLHDVLWSAARRRAARRAKHGGKDMR
ncbi:MAG: hypothetical protein V2I39_08820 [Erythrobacter sp.]|nr:hypothetical protein [Erythrobacter sp.]